MRKRKKTKIKALLLLLIVTISIGFAYLSATLGINGIAGIKGNKWDIHWDDESIVPTPGSVTPKTAAYVTDVEKKNVDFEVELELPGDFYEFTVDAVNEGSVAGKINKINSTFYKKGTDDVIEKPDCYIYEITHADGSVVEDDEILPPKTKKTYRVRLEFDKDATKLPDDEEADIKIKTDVGPTDPTKYLITYNPNGGSVTQLGVEIPKTQAIGTMPIAVKTNSTFTGWYTKADSGEKIESDHVPTEDMILYAHWSE